MDSGLGPSVSDPQTWLTPAVPWELIIHSEARTSAPRFALRRQRPGPGICNKLLGECGSPAVWELAANGTRTPRKPIL